jgi:hypothetical protein
MSLYLAKKSKICCVQEIKDFHLKYSCCSPLDPAAQGSRTTYI